MYLLKASTVGLGLFVFINIVVKNCIVLIIGLLSRTGNSSNAGK